MPPRPRPRPIPKASTSLHNVNAGPSESSQTPSDTNGKSVSPTELAATKLGEIVVNDSDEMFMRNRNRSSKTWQKLEKINKEVPKPADDSSGSGGDDQTATPRRRKRQKKGSNSVPTWQKEKDLKRLISVELTDSSGDEDVQIIGEASTPRDKNKRKRPRSRSRSITPPPALPQHQLQNARDVVRQALRVPTRPISPTIDLDDSTDEIQLQPEFMKLAKKIREEGRASSQVPEDEDEVVVTVTWIPHPLKPDAKSVSWQYKIGRGDSFRKLFDAVAEDAGILLSNLVLTYQNKRFFSSITCKTLSIWADTAEFDAYDQHAYNHIQEADKLVYTQLPPGPSKNRSSVPATSNGPIEIDSDSDEDGLRIGLSPPIQTQIQESDADSEAEQSDKFKIILRSADTGLKDIALLVKPSTKCGSIIKAFIKKAGLQDKYPHLFGGPRPKDAKDPKICVDGEKLSNDTEIGEMDLEDGDKVDVVGL